MHTFLILPHAMKDEIYSFIPLFLSFFPPFFLIPSLTSFYLSHTHTHENSKTLEETPSSGEAICRASGTRSFRGEHSRACVQHYRSCIGAYKIFTPPFREKFAIFCPPKGGEGGLERGGRGRGREGKRVCPR